MLLSVLRSSFQSVVEKLPLVRDIATERDRLRWEAVSLSTYQGFAPPGHFYSPIPDLDQIRRDESRVFGGMPRTIPGLELRESEQLTLLGQLANFYGEMPFQDIKVPGLRFYFDNPAYSYSDAILLYCMIRFLRPKRVIEVGSGFSSCVTLDTNERFFGGSIETTFIEPYPDLLRSLVKDDDRIRIIPIGLQGVDLREFDALEAGDILFIDSTHVSKIDSDVNRIFSEILPRLARGVHVHFHDIFYPFEYPKEWIYEGRAWTEIYMLKAFLQYNNAFSIVLMNTFMEVFHAQFFDEKMPLCMKMLGGSIWIRRN